VNPLLEKPAPRRKGLFAGGEIDAWCTRCRLDLGHRIVALVDGRPKRVVCMTCNSEHNYREPKSGPKATAARPAAASRASSSSASSSKSAAKPKATAGRTQWEMRTSGQALTAFARYSMDLTFGVDQLVSHKKFGEGYVVSSTGDKVTIAFRDGERTLVQKKSQ
jgi:hypothetical protein